MSNHEIWDTQSAPPPPPPLPQSTEPPQSSRAKWWFAVAGFILGVIIMTIGTSSEPKTITATAPTVTKTVFNQSAVATPTTVTETVEAPGPEKTVTVKAAPPKPETAFGPGAWLVGEDIAPGKYKTAEEVGEGCYWEITKGANGDDIVANEFVTETGGIQRVTIRKGQQFDSNGCGDWVKQ